MMTQLGYGDVLGTAEKGKKGGRRGSAGTGSVFITEDETIADKVVEDCAWTASTEQDHKVGHLPEMPRNG